MANLRLPPPTRFATWTLMYEAAANGLGVAIAVPAIAQGYLDSGRLVPCFESDVELDAAYSLVFASRALRRHPAVRALTRWLIEGMARSLEAYARGVAGALPG
jgi:LysR family glycine cleavage system transcriptional activator